MTSKMITLEYWEPHRDGPSSGPIYVLGTFSDWEPIQLSRHVEGNYRVDLLLGPGKYQYIYRDSEGHYMLDPNQDTEPDGNGNLNNLLRVAVLEEYLTGSSEWLQAERPETTEKYATTDEAQPKSPEKDADRPSTSKSKQKEESRESNGDKGRRSPARPSLVELQKKSSVKRLKQVYELKDATEHAKQIGTPLRSPIALNKQNNASPAARKNPTPRYRRDQSLSPPTLRSKSSSPRNDNTPGNPQTHNVASQSKRDSDPQLSAGSPISQTSECISELALPPQQLLSAMMPSTDSQQQPRRVQRSQSASEISSLPFCTSVVTQNVPLRGDSARDGFCEVRFPITSVPLVLPALQAYDLPPGTFLSVSETGPSPRVASSLYSQPTSYSLESEAGSLRASSSRRTSALPGVPEHETLPLSPAHDDTASALARAYATLLKIHSRQSSGRKPVSVNASEDEFCCACEGEADSSEGITSHKSQILLNFPPDPPGEGNIVVQVRDLHSPADIRGSNLALFNSMESSPPVRAMSVVHFAPRPQILKRALSWSCAELRRRPWTDFPSSSPQEQRKHKSKRKNVVKSTKDTSTSNLHPPTPFTAPQRQTFQREVTFGDPAVPTAQTDGAHSTRSEESADCSLVKRGLRWIKRWLRRLWWRLRRGFECGLTVEDISKRSSIVRRGYGTVV